MNPFKVIIVEDVKLELKGTEQIFRNEIPEAEIVGTAMTEEQLWPLMHNNTPDLVLLDLGLAGSTTAGIDVCKQLRRRYPNVHILIFTGEILNERLWVDALDAGADGIAVFVHMRQHVHVPSRVRVVRVPLVVLDDERLGDAAHHRMQAILHHHFAVTPLLDIVFKPNAAHEVMDAG